jgi:hypothetical protein
MFKTFSSSGALLSAIDFFKLSKMLKIYPSIVSLDVLKKVVTKSAEYWGYETNFETGSPDKSEK